MPLAKPLSFQDAFSASGKITASRDKTGGGVAYLGFFNHERQGWRPWSSMAIRLVNEGDKILVFLDYMTGKWAVGAAEMELSIPTDGSEHTWRLTYDRLCSCRRADIAPLTLITTLLRTTAWAASP